MRIVLALCLFLISSAQAQQTETIPDISQVEALSFELKLQSPKSNAWIEWDPLTQEQGDLNVVTLKGHANARVRAIKLDGNDVTIRPDRSFELMFGFPNERKFFVLSVMDDRGNVLDNNYEISGYSEIEAAALRAKQVRWRKTVGVGYTVLNYQQTRVAQFTENVVTLKGGLSYILKPKKYDLGLSAFYNAAVLKNTSSTKIQYLGVNLKFAYHWIDGRSPWHVNLNGGAYYNTSFSTVGFANVFGPQFYPEISYSFRRGRAITTYFKFSPVTTNGSLDFSKNKEIATGVYYSFPIAGQRRLGMGVDYSKLNLSIGSSTAETSTVSGSVSLSL